MPRSLRGLKKVQSWTNCWRSYLVENSSQIESKAQSGKGKQPRPESGGRAIAGAENRHLNAELQAHYRAWPVALCDAEPIPRATHPSPASNQQTGKCYFSVAETVIPENMIRHRMNRC